MRVAYLSCCKLWGCKNVFVIKVGGLTSKVIQPPRLLMLHFFLEGVDKKGCKFRVSKKMDLIKKKIAF